MSILKGDIADSVIDSLEDMPKDSLFLVVKLTGINGIGYIQTSIAGTLQTKKNEDLEDLPTSIIASDDVTHTMWETGEGDIVYVP